jgi:MoaA/NifB/PqqE/SkfB family radical SAM enzyme
MKLAILYRGPLSSCNYGCDYCPFAKHTETADEHARDAQALHRFVAWVAGRASDQISVFFTPWGEALIRRRYQRAFIALTNMPHVEKVAIQTNLACRLDWVEQCVKERVGIWATYHPSQVERPRFVARCRELDARGVRLSVGVVGLKEHAGEIEALRDELPPHIYVWVNAYKRLQGYYSDDDLRRLSAVDPLFPFNNQYHESAGRACNTGETVISVDGDGTMRRCHFVKAPIGSIYDPGFAQALRPRPCSNDTCGCHIGYIHMPHLGLHDVFGEGMLERIPVEPIWLQAR